MCIVNNGMTWYFLSWVLGSDIYLYQETLYRSESCGRKLRRTSPYRPPRMATRVCPTCWRRYFCSSITCRPTWLLPSALSPPFCLRFITRMPKRSCILELGTNGGTNVLNATSYAEAREPNCDQGKKTQCLSCFTRKFRNMLTSFQTC